MMMPRLPRAALCGLFLVTACDDEPTVPRHEFVPEMVDSVASESFTENPVLPGGVTMQPPPAGSVAREVTYFRYGPGDKEAERAGRELQNPLKPANDDLSRGEALYRRFCTPCHGPTGAGDGPIVPRFPTPPALTATHAREMPDGRIYHVISRGQGLMPSHALQVMPMDRWRLVLHLRAMQGAAKAPATTTAAVTTTPPVAPPATAPVAAPPAAAASPAVPAPAGAKP